MLARQALSVISNDQQNKEGSGNEETDLGKLLVRISELEAENRCLRAENEKLKRRQEINADGPSAKRAAVASGDGLSDKEKQKILKRLGGAVARKAKSAKFHSCGANDITVEESMLADHFHELFHNVGKLVQPTKDNKPKSAVTIRTLTTWGDILTFFGNNNISQTVQCDVWSKGGWRFQKARKMYSSQADIVSLEIQYNKTNMKLQLKFGCQLRDDYGYGDSDY